MKINVNYYDLHIAIDKFKNNEKLDEYDKDLILTMLIACEGDYYPSKEELKAQEKRILRLDKINCIKNEKEYMKILKECGEFENKYC